MALNMGKRKDYIDESPQVIKNDEGGIVYMAGLLPDGTYGIVADQARAFTQEELTDVAKFKVHADDLARRVDEYMHTMTS